MKLLRGLTVLMVAGGALGLTACATCDDGTCAEGNVEYFGSDNMQDVYDPVDAECLNDSNACLVGQDDGAFLTENFVETYEVPVAENRVENGVQVPAVETSSNETLVIQDDAALALSRPSAGRGVSVKDKQAAALAETPAVVTVKTVKTVETVPAAVVVPAPKAEEPVAIQVEPVKETVKPQEKKVVEVQEKRVAESQEKKVTTTITETTTTKKVQTEGIAEDGESSDTLKGRIAYGQQVHDWEARPGDTLRMLLMTWGEKSGWTVVWKLDRDYHLEAGVVFRGNFTDAAGAIVRSFARATPAPIGTFYQGNRVLVVSTQEDENER